jgi:hypothetical protein
MLEPEPCTIWIAMIGDCPEHRFKGGAVLEVESGLHTIGKSLQERLEAQDSIAFKGVAKRDAVEQ